MLQPLDIAAKCAQPDTTATALTPLVLFDLLLMMKWNKIWLTLDLTPSHQFDPTILVALEGPMPRCPHSFHHPLPLAMKNDHLLPLFPLDLPLPHPTQTVSDTKQVDLTG